MITQSRAESRAEPDSEARSLTIGTSVRLITPSQQLIRKAFACGDQSLTVTVVHHDEFASGYSDCRGVDSDTPSAIPGLSCLRRSRTEPAGPPTTLGRLTPGLGRDRRDGRLGGCN